MADVRSLLGTLFFCLAALTINSAAQAGSTKVELSTTGTPPGFEELSSARMMMVDVYFGGRKVGDALVTTKPGLLRSPSQVLAGIPQLVSSAELSSALAAELPTNDNLACSQSNSGDCGSLSPQLVGIIYDEDHFRVDLFINPRFLKTVPTGSRGYLPVPNAPLSLTSSVGLAAAGTFGGSSVYNLQNRTVIGFHNARIRMNSSLASRIGFLVDDLVGEIDSKDLRYSAGLFWAPGSEFTGERRVLGAGIGTQFDTWADQQSLRGTPLIVFLSGPSRIELLVDGRLISARSYPAGNVEIDSSALPEGSYSVLLRVHQSNGSVREERRFFVKNAQAPPVGHPIFYGYAGVLANTRRHQPISASNSFYYQAGGAWRLNDHLALGVDALGTRHKAIGEAGAWLIFRRARFRVAGLASSAGDAGALVQASWGGDGPFSLNVDLRRIWSGDGKPLIPLPSYVETFSETPPVGVQLATASYTQATASLGLRLGSGSLQLIGSYRKDRSFPADYTIGPAINWPLVTRGRMQLVAEASAQRTRSTTAGFAGLRLLFNRGELSVLARLGESTQDERGDGRSSVSRAIGEVSAQYSHQAQDGTLLNLEAGADRNIDSANLNAGTTLYSRLGNVRADLLRNVEGAGGTQYDLSYESAVALTSNGASLGGRDLQQSALIVTLRGDSPDAFNVLIDEVVRGRLRPGQRLSLFVPGYRTYKVRLIPAEASAVSFDTSAREVTLYPGNVQLLEWRTESFFTIFAQAMSATGSPVANALVRTPKAISETDSNGYFQIDVRRGDAITIDGHNGQSCEVKLPDIEIRNDFASAGKVVCR